MDAAHSRAAKWGVLVSDGGIRIDRHDSDLGRWELASRDPHLALRFDVRRYQGYIETGTGAIRRREAPSGDVVLIINLGPPYWVSGGGGVQAPVVHDSFVAGLHDAFALVDSPGAAFCLEVEFTPLGAYRFFRTPMHLLTGRTVELTDLIGRAAGRIADRLHAAADWSARFRLLDRIIAARVAGGADAAAPVRHAWRRLEACGGAVRVGALAQSVGWSRKHLVRQFREQVGLPPKTVARILRFGRAVDLLEAADLSLAAVAVDCGYADQAHMTRDFRRFAGYTPADFVKRQVPAGGIVER